MTGRPEVEEAHAHPGGACARAHVPCAGCGLPAPIAIKYGGPMADCRPCRYGWSVHHDPVRCRQRTRTDEALIARIREVAPLLVSARAVLDGIVRRL
ncbi:hypothetical protein BCL76_108366 [Streptomyces sp. CG 926]|uniref:hypothetical protein n=1 Tax=Streptomyces sp. CG 926 TaxID=1882405 RepID=UPI000D6BA773|nr:hypothetical protein [Streptomyces sp. CG 926]PWK68048.1 hypothetical protein BCL76_108366 [Streptomyces sp. CG 926]